MELFLNKLNIDEIITSTLGESSLIYALEEILHYLGDNIKNEHKEKIVYVLEWYRREKYNKPY